MSIQRYKLELYQLSTSLEAELKKIIKKHEGQIVGMVKNRLYQTGRDGTGKSITPSYSASTIKYKKERNKRSSHVTLRDEGLFYDGFYLELVDYVLLLDSKDGKTASLLDKYGDAILEFTKEEQNYIFENIIDYEIELLIRKAELNSSSASGIELDLF